MGKIVDRLRILLHTVDLFLLFLILILNMSRPCILQDHTYFFVQYFDMVVSAYTTWAFVLLISACIKEKLEPKTDKILFIGAALLTFLALVISAVDYTERTDYEILSLIILVMVAVVTLNHIIEVLMIFLSKPPSEDE